MQCHLGKASSVKARNTIVAVIAIRSGRRESQGRERAAAVP